MNVAAAAKTVHTSVVSPTADSAVTVSDGQGVHMHVVAITNNA